MVSVCDSPPATATPDRLLRSLPLLTLHLTERCNSKCISCDYWRHGRGDISLESVRALLPELQALGTHTVLLSGGEPLIHPEWFDIAQLLRANGLRLWLVTSGLSLLKFAKQVAECFDNIAVSMDGADPEMYLRIRGVNAFDKVCAGISAVSAINTGVGLRVTLQRQNYFALGSFVDLARTLGVADVSFLAADVSNQHSFGRVGEFKKDIALGFEHLPIFERVLDAFELKYAHEFRSGLIAESPQKLRRLHAYFTALCGLGEFPAVKCNAPEFSAVIETSGAINPCFFIRGPEDAVASAGLSTSLNSKQMADLRDSIRLKRRVECGRCVCSLWREPNETAIAGMRRSAAGLLA